MYLAVNILLFGSLGFTITWLMLQWLCTDRRWRRLNRAAAQLHHAGRSRVVRLGGVGLIGAFGILVFLGWMNLAGDSDKNAFHAGLVLGTLGMFGLGFWDDVKPLGAKRKLLGQVLIALVAVRLGLQIEGGQNPFTGTRYEFGMASDLLTVLWLVAWVNLVNFIDGMDGLAGGLVLMLMLLLAFMGLGTQGFTFVLAVGMAGSLHAFLHYNFPPAKIYLGDGGAYMLGFLIAGMTILNSQKGTVLAAMLAPLMALGLPIMDSVVTVLRRAVVGLPMFRADRRHLHHKLLARGLTRRRAVLTLYALSIPCLGLAFGAFLLQGRLAPLMFGILFMALAGWIFQLRRTTSSFRHLASGAWELSRLRSESRYAMCLGQWLWLEAERCGSQAELWEGFGFLAGKLGFAHVQLVSGADTRLWQSNHRAFEDDTLLRAEHRVGGSMPMELVFTAEQSRLEPGAFEHLTELAAEAWCKSARHHLEVVGREDRGQRVAP